MADPIRKLAVVTGASTGIGLELARECAKNGFDLLIAADEPKSKRPRNSYVARAVRSRWWKRTSRP